MSWVTPDDIKAMRKENFRSGWISGLLTGIVVTALVGALIFLWVVIRGSGK